ncbi:MAG TPA: hypothetical protein VII44_04235 [Puia sp.]
MAQPFHMQSQNAYITAGAYSIHFTDAFSFESNPACLGASSGFLIAVLAERKWMLKELDNYALAASCILGKGGLGISLQRSGDTDYSEQALELAYGKNLGRLEMGIRFGYLQDKAAGYRGIGFGSSGIGMRFHVSEKMITGWELGLPVFGRAGKSNPEKGPQYFRMGFGYEWRADLFLALQIIKASGLPLNVISSIEYRYSEQFFFSFGVNSNAGSPYFKTGWKKNRLCIQIYTVYEPVLGFSPGILLLWENRNKKG